MSANISQLKTYIKQNEKALKVYTKANLYGQHNNQIKKLEIQIRNANRKLKSLS
ncbi:MAG: hypothetical protein PHQ49_05595 [Clostridia bacterium]|jgi:hypothetical protein|nr:hypothetical protein [Clostridia bacterium]